MALDVRQVICPVVVGRVDQLIQGIEYGELHIGEDAMNHSYPLVGQVEQDSVLVGDPRRADQPTRIAV